MRTEPKRIMVEIEADAVAVLTDKTYCAGFQDWAPDQRALAPLRLALTTAGLDQRDTRCGYLPALHA